MHQISVLLLSILLITLTGCEDKKPDGNTTTRGNSSIKIKEDTFVLTKDTGHKVTLSSGKIIFHNNDKPIVIVNVFATWCTPCVWELAYLNTLYETYSEDLFLIGVLAQEDIDAPTLKSFITEHKIKYFISNTPQNDAFGTLLAASLGLPKKFSIPLTVMYVEGKYFTHYEGSVPIEMIEYDIKQAQKQLKSKKN